MECRPRPACQARACPRAPRRSRPAPRHSPTGLAAAGIAAGSSRRRPGPGLCGPRAAPLRLRELAWSREVARTRPVSTAAFGPPRRGRAWASRRPPSRGAGACCQHNACYRAAQRKRAAAHRALTHRPTDCTHCIESRVECSSRRRATAACHQRAKHGSWTENGTDRPVEEEPPLPAAAVGRSRPAPLPPPAAFPAAVGAWAAWAAWACGSAAIARIASSTPSRVSRAKSRPPLPGLAWRLRGPVGAPAGSTGAGGSMSPAAPGAAGGRQSGPCKSSSSIGLGGAVGSLPPLRAQSRAVSPALVRALGSAPHISSIVAH